MKRTFVNKEDFINKGTFVNKGIAAAVTALAMTAAVSPATAQAAGAKVYYIGKDSCTAEKDCDQEALIKRLKYLGVNTDCLKWAQDILDGVCSGAPIKPEAPIVPERPTKPEEPIIPEKPTQPEKPVIPEKPTESGKPITPERPTEAEKPVVPDRPTMPERPTEAEKPTVAERPTEAEKPSKPETPTEPQKPTTPGQPENSYAAQVIELVNKERAKEGLHPLVYDAALERAALVRAKEIQTNFSHTRPDGSSFSSAVREENVAYRRVGENIAWGQRSPEEVVSAWMNSPSHRENIMRENFGRIGVGYLTNAKGVSYWVQLFAD